MNLPAQSQRTINTQAIEIAIRLGVIFVIVMSCFNILTPLYFPDHVGCNHCGFDLYTRDEAFGKNWAGVKN